MSVELQQPGTLQPVSDGPEPAPAALPMGAGQRAVMVVCGYIPFLNVIAMAALVVFPAFGLAPTWLAALAPAWLLLLPPLVVRLTLRWWPLASEEIPLASRHFLVWWFTAQWQTIFNRLPFIEEIIRLFPGLYSSWLRLWGAKIGRFVYWTPGLRILDRALLQIGDRVVFGAGVRLNPHVILPDDQGRLVLRAAVIRIGNDVLIGGYSLLLAGAWIADGQATPAELKLRPFGGWENGRRTKLQQTEAEEA